MVKIHEESTVFTSDQILKLQEHYNGVHLFDTTHISNDNQPIAVFYTPNPNRDLGHTNFFSLSYIHEQLMIGEATEAATSWHVGIVEDDILYNSRFRHDYRKTPNGRFIDGGRAYTRSDLGERVEFKFTIEGKLEIK